MREQVPSEATVPLDGSPAPRLRGTQEAAVETWARSLVEAIEAAPFDETYVTSAHVPQEFPPEPLRHALIRACDERGLLVVCLPGTPRRRARRGAGGSRSVVAVIEAGVAAPWSELIELAATERHLQAVVSLKAWEEGADGASRTLVASEITAYPDLVTHPHVAAEPAGSYGPVSEPGPQSAAVAPWRLKEQAAWVLRRGDWSGAASRLREASAAATRDGDWVGARRHLRSALTECGHGLDAQESFDLASRLARVMWELDALAQATQVATVVTAAGSWAGVSRSTIGEACVTLAAVAEARGHLPLARGWLARGAEATPGFRPWRHAVSIRVALASVDTAWAARLAHHLDHLDSSEDDLVDTLVAAARVHAHLGDATGCAKMLEKARTLARTYRSRSDTAWVGLASAALAARYGRPFVPTGTSQRRIEARRAWVSPRARRELRRIRGPSGGPSTSPVARLPHQRLESPVEPGVVHEVVELLRLCQTDEEEASIAEAVCRYLRDRSRASGVGVWLPGSAAGPIVGAGRCQVSETFAQRVVSVDWVVGPVSSDPGTIAGVAVRYAGSAIGVLAARWAGSPVVPSNHLIALLGAASAALGPAVAALPGAVRSPCDASADGSGLLGSSPPIQALRDSLRKCAASPFPVLVLGESGSGKELVAKAIHAWSSRRSKRFCAVNCAALTDELFDAELFGHAKGAFTGAIHERRGLFEEADGGTLFLDEVGELTPRAQAKLLRVLQEREVRRVGENVSRRIDVRIVAATNRDLATASRTGAFRLDLLYRLDVISVRVPPLRDRPGDVTVLAYEFWREVSQRVGTRAALAPDLLAALSRYHWPGNVRELQNVITALAVSAPKRGRADVRHLPRCFHEPSADQPLLPLAQARQRFDQQHIGQALTRAGGSRARAARLLGITRQGLAKMLQRHGATLATGSGVTRASGRLDDSQGARRLV